MLNHPRRALAALLAVAAATAACSSSGQTGGTSSLPAGSSAATSAAPAGFPVTVHAANDTVTLAKEPAAIVSLSPTATEMLFAIGAGRQVKAADSNSDYPPNAPRTKLNALQFNAESIAAYRPDLVVSSGLTAAQQTQLQKLSIPVLDEPAAADLSASYQEISQLGQATGHPDGAAATIASMRRKIAAIVRATPKPARAETYYYELDQTHYSVTSSTFVGRTLKLLGLSSIADSAKGAAAAGGYPQLSAEYILKAQPDYVFLADTRCCKQSAATVARRAGWSTLSAVRDHRVVALNDDIASRWGPRIVDLLQTVSAAIRAHPAGRQS